MKTLKGKLAIFLGLKSGHALLKLGMTLLV